MKNSNHVISLLILVILLLPQFSLSQPILSTPRFDIYAHDANLGKEIEIALESSYRKISDFLDDSLTDVVHVYAVNSEDEFRSLVGNGFPDWGVGCAVPSQNLIVLKSPLRFKYYRPFSQVVTHELAHIFLGKFSRGGRIPRWLDEGFAMYQSQEWVIGQDIVVARAVLTGSILPLSQIEAVNAFGESKAELAYTESFLAVSYLDREYGEGTIKELVTNLSGGVGIDLAFLRTIGSNYLSFQLEFAKYIKTHYNWVSFLGDTFFVWLGLAFLIIFLYFLKRRYTRKTLEEWELEEQGIKRMDEFSDDQT
ncbi:MAG: peptidase MA family metallohydrolase [Candidatus Zixiibacteriota bacterium]